MEQETHKAVGDVAREALQGFKAKINDAVYEDIVERITEAAAFGARGLSLFEAEDASEGYATFINPGDLVDGLAEVCVNIGHWIDWDNLAERLEKEKLTVLWIRMVDEGIDVIDAIIWVEEKEGKLS